MQNTATRCALPVDKDDRLLAENGFTGTVLRITGPGLLLALTHLQDIYNSDGRLDVPAVQQRLTLTRPRELRHDVWYIEGHAPNETYRIMVWLDKNSRTPIKSPVKAIDIQKCVDAPFQDLCITPV